MEESLELVRYLPISFKTEAEREYVAFLWDTFQSNYENGKFQFAFLAYHMLVMCFVYFNVWQIKQGHKEAFKNALVGFANDTERKLEEASSPFVFSAVNERAILRFLKLIGCDNSEIGAYGKLVEDRNDTAHANGNVYYKDKPALDRKIGEILRIVSEIQSHSKPIIEACYRDFLVTSYSPDEREYESEDDQIREILIHQNYFSQKDLEFCFFCDLTSLKEHEYAGDILVLHALVIDRYGTEDVYDIDWNVGQSSSN